MKGKYETPIQYRLPDRGHPDFSDETMELAYHWAEQLEGFLERLNRSPAAYAGALVWVASASVHGGVPTVSQQVVGDEVGISPSVIRKTYLELFMPEDYPTDLPANWRD